MSRGWLIWSLIFCFKTEKNHCVFLSCPRQKQNYCRDTVPCSIYFMHILRIRFWGKTNSFVYVYISIYLKKTVINLIFSLKFQKKCIGAVNYSIIRVTRPEGVTRIIKSITRSFHKPEKLYSIARFLAFNI